MADAGYLCSMSGVNEEASVTNFVVDSTTDGWAWAFQPYTADPITHLGFRYGARVGTPVVHLIQLEGLDTSGLPDGADVGGGSPTSVTFTPPADTSIDGLWQWKTLTNAYTPTRGQMLAAVIRISSGTPDGSNSSSFTSTSTIPIARRGFPYNLTLNSGTWSKVASPPIGGYRTASGRYGQIYQGNYTTAVSTSGHRVGMYFTLPAGHGDTFKISGAYIYLQTPAAAGSFKVILCQTDGTLLQSVTYDSDHSSLNSNTMSWRATFADTTLATLSFGTKYYLGVEATGTNVHIRGATLQEAGDMTAWPDGANRGLFTFNGATYTETTSTYMFVEPIFADITEPSAGGGGLLNYPGLNGRING